MANRLHMFHNKTNKIFGCKVIINDRDIELDYDYFKNIASCFDAEKAAEEEKLTDNLIDKCSSAAINNLKTTTRIDDARTHNYYDLTGLPMAIKFESYLKALKYGAPRAQAMEFNQYQVEALERGASVEQAAQFDCYRHDALKSGASVEEALQFDFAKFKAFRSGYSLEYVLDSTFSGWLEEEYANVFPTLDCPMDCIRATKIEGPLEATVIDKITDERPNVQIGNVADLQVVGNLSDSEGDL